MNHARIQFWRRLGAVAGILFLVVPPIRTVAQERAAGDSVVVLRNGRVLHGQVTYLGDQCSIALSGGGQVQLIRKELAVVAASKAEAYRQLRDEKVSRKSAREHLELARWCMRESLFAEAADELLTVMELDPRNPQIEALNRQLHAIVKHQSSPPSPAGTAPAATEKSATEEDELELLVKTIPKDAVEHFTRTLQPLLMNRCGTSRCHGGGSTAAYRLLRPSVGKNFWRRLSLTNLHSTVKQIDGDNPDASPLLRMAITAHGGANAPPLGEKEPDQYETLVAWVRIAASGGTIPQLKTNPTVLVSAEMPVDAEPANKPAPPPPLTRTESGFRGAGDLEPVPASISQDPFDPEIFNRRFHQKTQPN
jgi:hypothetical protein